MFQNGDWGQVSNQTTKRAIPKASRVRHGSGTGRCNEPRARRTYACFFFFYMQALRIAAALFYAHVDSSQQTHVPVWSTRTGARRPNQNRTRRRCSMARQQRLPMSSSAGGGEGRATGRQTGVKQRRRIEEIQKGRRDGCAGDGAGGDQRQAYVAGNVRS